VRRCSSLFASFTLQLTDHYRIEYQLWSFSIDEVDGDSPGTMYGYSLGSSGNTIGLMVKVQMRHVIHAIATVTNVDATGEPLTNGTAVRPVKASMV
jgi:hypothetical protein